MDPNKLISRNMRDRIVLFCSSSRGKKHARARIYMFTGGIARTRAHPEIASLIDKLPRAYARPPVCAPPAHKLIVPQCNSVSTVEMLLFFFSMRESRVSLAWKTWECGDLKLPETAKILALAHDFNNTQISREMLSQCVFVTARPL